MPVNFSEFCTSDSCSNFACETSGRLWVGVSQVKLKFHGNSRAVEHRSHFARLTMAAQIVAMLCMLMWAFLSLPPLPFRIGYFAFTRLFCLHSAILPSIGYFAFASSTNLLVALRLLCSNLFWFHLKCKGRRAFSLLRSCALRPSNAFSWNVIK